MPSKSPLEMLYHWENTCPEKIYLKQPIAGVYKDFTWQEVGQQARKIAAELVSMGLDSGSHIAILSKNCAEWLIADLAIMIAGHISVPIFATSGVSTISYILEHADCKAIFIGKLDNTADQVTAISPHIRQFAFPYPNIPADKQWAQLLDNSPVEESPTPDIDTIMTIIYTSGSTGNPKGVVHTYKSLVWGATQLVEVNNVTQNDRMLSYLPLAHIAERIFVEFGSLYSGMRIDFIESLETFSRDIGATQPTMFFSVPRLWTRFQMGVLAGIAPNKLKLLLAIPIIGTRVSAKIRKKLGLSQARLCSSGSAPIPPATLMWFHKLGVNISEGWGMTENSAYGSSCVPFRADKIGSIGIPMPGVDMRISDEGEIQVKSPCNMLEYYLEPEKTAEVFTADGYLRTGDKGSVDAEGYFKITGRLKEIFKTSKGEYIAPAPIESKLMTNSWIEQVCVTGSLLTQPIALLVLSDEAKKQRTGEVEQSLLATFNEVNVTLENHAVLGHLVIVRDGWTVENGLLTPTLKIRRHVIEDHYATYINSPMQGEIVTQGD